MAEATANGMHPQRTEALLVSGTEHEAAAQTHALIYVGDQIARLAAAVEEFGKIGGPLDRRRGTTIPVERGGG